MINKQAIFEEARATMREWYPSLIDQPGACLYWNQVAMRTLIRHGFRPVLQAGSMHWKINNNPDPTVPCCFGYEWSPHEPLSVRQLEQGLLPEVHIWCGLKETNELIDFSTGYFRQVAEEVHGLTWTAPPPPEFVWGPMPDAAIYIPNRDATLFIWRFILEKQGVAA